MSRKGTSTETKSRLVVARSWGRGKGGVMAEKFLSGVMKMCLVDCGDGFITLSSVQSLSHVRLFATPCTPGLPVHHQLPESTQTHIHRVDDAIQPSNPPSSPSPPVLNFSQHQGLFQWVITLNILKHTHTHTQNHWIVQFKRVNYMVCE